MFCKTIYFYVWTEIYRIVSQNVSTPMDKAVESILKWLQTRYKQKNRIGEFVKSKSFENITNILLHEQKKTISFFQFEKKS